MQKQSVRKRQSFKYVCISLLNTEMVSFGFLVDTSKRYKYVTVKQQSPLPRTKLCLSIGGGTGGPAWA